MNHRSRCAALLALALMLAAITASAAGPVLESGREREVLALFAPYTLGAEVTQGEKLWDVRIQATEIVVGLRGASGDRPSLRLVHASSAPPGAETSESFAIVRLMPSTDATGTAASQLLSEAVKRNDGGGFWRAYRELPHSGGPESAIRRRVVADGRLILYLLIAALLSTGGARLSGEPR
jgi:hypothetical protein